jgi:hypothetical protein
VPLPGQDALVIVAVNPEGRSPAHTVPPSAVSTMTPPAPTAKQVVALEQLMARNAAMVAANWISQ